MSIICKELNWLLLDQDTLAIPPIGEINDTTIAIAYETFRDEAILRGLLKQEKAESNDIKLHNKIVNYRLVTEQGYTALQNAIDKNMELGWQPFGGIAITTTRVDHINYAQAMVKYAANV